MEAPPVTSESKPSLFRVTLISFAACFLIGECALRTVLYRTTPAMFAPSDYTTFQLVESGTFRHKGSEFDVTYELSDGWHGPPPEARRGQRKRILLLGDSFCFGHGVADGETTARRLQERLGDQVEVINGAYRAGKSFDDAHAWFAAEGEGLKPDAVIYLSYPLNDFADIADNQWSRVDERGGPLAVRALFDRPNALGLRGPLHALDEMVFHRSAVLTVLWRRVLARHVMTLPEANGPAVKALSASRKRMESESFRTAYARGLLAVDALADRVQAQGGDFALFTITPILALAPEDESLKAWNGVASVAMEDYDPQALNKALRNDLDKRGITTLASETVTLEDYYRSDAHWRPSGHEKAAEAISQWLQRSVLQ